MLERCASCNSADGDSNGTCGRRIVESSVIAAILRGYVVGACRQLRSRHDKGGRRSRARSGKLRAAQCRSAQLERDGASGKGAIGRRDSRRQSSRLAGRQRRGTCGDGNLRSQAAGGLTAPGENKVIHIERTQPGNLIVAYTRVEPHWNGRGQASATRTGRGNDVVSGRDVVKGIGRALGQNVELRIDVAETRRRLDRKSTSEL